MAKLPTMALKYGSGSHSNQDIHGIPFVSNSLNDVAVTGAVVNAYAEALQTKTTAPVLNTMFSEEGQKYFLRATGTDASEDARTWINNIVPALADETRYTFIWYHP